MAKKKPLLFDAARAVAAKSVRTKVLAGAIATHTRGREIRELLENKAFSAMVVTKVLAAECDIRVSPSAVRNWRTDEQPT